MLKSFRLSLASRYFLTIFYIFIALYKTALSGQYLYSVQNHFPILFVFPLSLIFASFDFICLFIFVKICDFINKSKPLSLIYFVLFLSLGAFLLYDFSIYQYFRGFTNFGLANFLVYDSGELSRYFIFSLNPFLIGMIFFYLVLLVLSLIFVFKGKTWIIKPSNSVLSRLLVVNALLFLILLLFPYEQKVNLDKDPLFEYLSTAILQSRYLPLSKEVKTAEYPTAKDEESFPKIDFDYGLTKGKNVILIILESSAFARTPLGGDEMSRFSFLTDLSKKSLNFTSHRTIFPATTRSVLSLFCSDYSGTDYKSITNSDVSFNCNSIFDAFQKNGYRASFFSPVLLDFDNFGNCEIIKRIEYLFEPSRLLKSGDYKRRFGTSSAVEEEIVQEDFFKEILSGESRNGPFFAVYFPYWTHAPYEVPFESVAGLSSLERYYKSQEYLNEKMEQFLERLEKENLLENSIVILTADHGEAFGKKVGDYIHPNYLYDENLHVPFLIYVKGVTDISPKTITNPTTVLDVAPTIAKLAGIEPDDEWIGNSMFDGVSDPVFIYTRAMRLNSGILKGNRKFFFNHVDGEDYYFDLKNDPQEENNLAEMLDPNYLKQLKNYVKYKNFEINDRVLKKNRSRQNAN